MATSEPPECIAQTCALFLATLALNSTCTLNLKPSNYLQSNRDIDFTLVMQQAVGAGVGWSAQKNWDPLGAYKACLGVTASWAGERETCLC